jgi:hypothetical protein
MFYNYRCNKGHITETSQSPMIDIPKTVPCETCGEDAARVYGNSMIIIPEDFKATSEMYHNDTYADIDNLKSKFSHSHPSGRTGKIYY